MKFVFTSYVVTNTYNDPLAWLERIKAYSGVLEALALNHEVVSIEQIDHEGDNYNNGVHYKFRKFHKNWSYFPFKQNFYIWQQKPDVVFVQSLHFPLQVLLLRLVLGNRAKIIVQNHAEKPFTGFKKRIQLLADGVVNAYLFASKPMGLDWVNKGNLPLASKIHEVMETSSVFYPMDKNEARRKTGVKGRQVFLWVGRLDANKDPMVVVKAFLKYVAINPGARLYMIYHTEELLPIIKAFLNNAPNAESVILVGKVPNADLQYWYNGADVFIAASYYEGSGTAVCEAMSCGCVPVVTDIFSFRMITDNGNIGLLFPAGNEAKLLAALHQIPEMDMQAEREKALAYFASDLSFNAIARKIATIAAGL